MRLRESLGGSIESLEDGFPKYVDFVVGISEPADDDRAFEWRDKYRMSLGFRRGYVPDISGLGGNAIGGVSRARRLAFSKKAKIARNHFLAIAERPTEANIRALLNKMFGL